MFGIPNLRNKLTWLYALSQRVVGLECACCITIIFRIGIILTAWRNFSYLAGKVTINELTQIYEALLHCS